MDFSIIRPIIAVLDFLGIRISPEDALLLVLLTVGLSFVGYVLVKITALSIDMKGMQVRQDMHADHFDVLDDTHSQAQRDASTALENASDAKGSVNTLIAILKKKSP